MNDDAATPPTVTADTPDRPVPVSVTDVPPAVEPKLGEIDEIDGLLDPADSSKNPDDEPFSDNVFVVCDPTVTTGPESFNVIEEKYAVELAAPQTSAEPFPENVL